MRFLSLCLCTLLCMGKVMGCTGILMQAKNGAAVSGRTVEFGIPLDMSVAVIPRNHSFEGKIPSGSGIKYQSKYGAVGIYCFDDPVLMDGINEKGLVAAAFYFPGYAHYAQITSENREKALSPADFPNWILTQFATIEEVKKALSSVCIAPTVLKNWGSAPPPMHYIVYDSSGKSIVIEPLEGTLKVYENELGVITNSPTFDWHLTNLNNYINLTPYNVEMQKLRSFELHALGQGTGMLGLPGDFSPPSRFVRAAFFSATAVFARNDYEAVDQTFHILNQFDIPLGSIRQKEKNSVSYDYTLLTSVKNPHELKYYFRSYENQAIQFVDLRQFDLNAQKIMTKKIQDHQKYIDITSTLKHAQ